MAFLRRSRIKSFAIAAGATGSLAAARLALPRFFTNLINKKLAHIPPYQGHVSSLEIHPISGRASLLGLSLEQRVDGAMHHLLSVPRAGVILDWKRLFRGGLVADIIVDHPDVIADVEALKASKDTASRSASPARDTKGNETTRWQTKVRKLFAFQLNLVIQKGTFHVKGLPGQDGTDLVVHDFDLAVENFTNSTRLSSALMARAEGSARLLSHGRLELHAQGYPLADKPTFNTDVKVEHVDLAELSSFAKTYAGIDVKGGTFDTYMEAAAKEGHLQGYAKPVIEKLNLERLKDRPLKIRLEAAGAEAAVKLLESRKEDRIATTVDFDGDLSDPSFDMMGTVGVALKNAFFKAIGADFENRLWFERAGKEARDVQIHYAKPKTSRMRKALRLIKESAVRWSNDHAPRMAAALSYYTAFSLAPLLLLLIAIAGLVFGKQAAQGQILDQLRGLVGTQSAATLQSMIQAANRPAQGIAATIISLISLGAGAFGVLSELKQSLNLIWETQEPSGVKAIVKRNIKFLGIVAAIGFLLLVSLAVSAALAALEKYLGGALPIPPAAMHGLYFIVSWAIVSALFAVIFRVLPNSSIPWKDVWIGSVVTALLFSIGKVVLGMYLGKGTVGSSYGAAGSVLIILLWVYYSGLIFYYGAEFTRVYSEHYGSRA